MNRKLLICILCLMLSGPVFNAKAAQAEEHKKQSGFSGRIDAGAAMMKTESHLEVGDDNKRLDSLNQSPKSETEMMPLVFFELNYDYGDGQRIYGGMPFDFENEPRPTLGWKTNMGRAGVLDLSVFYSLPEEVWEDPYLTGVDRKETDQDAYGTKIQYGLGDWEFSYELEFVDVDNDQAGMQLADLKRDGTIHDIEIAYEIEVADLTLEPSLGVTLGDIDGKSNRYKGGSAGIEMTKRWDRFMFWMMAEASVLDYDASHPIFNETRKDKEFGATAILSWLDPFGYDRFSLSLGTGYEKVSSNIDFYDSDNLFCLITLSYEFGASGGHDDDDD